MDKKQWNDRRVAATIFFLLMATFCIGVSIWRFKWFLFESFWSYLIIHSWSLLWCSIFSLLGIAFYNWIRREDEDTKGYWYYLFYFCFFQFPISLASSYGAYLSLAEGHDARKWIFSALTALIVSLYGEKIPGDPLKMKVN